MDRIKFCLKPIFAFTALVLILAAVLIYQSESPSLTVQEDLSLLKRYIPLPEGTVAANFIATTYPLPDVLFSGPADFEVVFAVIKIIPHEADKFREKAQTGIHSELMVPDKVADLLLTDDLLKQYKQDGSNVIIRGISVELPSDNKSRVPLKSMIISDTMIMTTRAWRLEGVDAPKEVSFGWR